MARLHFLSIMLIMALLLAACASVQDAAPTETPIKATPTEVPASITVGTPIPGVVPSGGLTASPVPDGTPAGDVIQVTLADNRTTLSLHVGQAFLLKLGEIYDWNVEVADSAIVSREVNVLVVRGAQGIYQAHEPGTTQLTAQGDPACRKSVPACAMPSIAFMITLVVKP